MPRANIQSDMPVAKPWSAKRKTKHSAKCVAVYAHSAVKWVDLMEPAMKKYFPIFALAVLAFAPLSKAEQASPLRSAAIHACSVESAKFLFHLWQLEQFAVYGTCMTKHGQRFD